MPRLSNALFSSQVTSLEQDILLHLITINVPSVGTHPAVSLYLVDHNTDITFQGNLYTTFPLQFSGGFNHSSDGSIDKAQISCANPERVLMPYIENYNYLMGTTVQVVTIYNQNLISNPNAYITDYYTVDSYVANDTTLTLMLDPNINFGRKIPKCTYNSNSCRFRYKDPVTCKYSGPLTSCQKTLQDCTAHSKPFYPSFDPSVYYTVGAQVSYGTSVYTCTSASAAGILPTNTGYWSVLTLTKSTDVNNNSVLWSSSAFPLNLRPGYQIIINGATYTLRSANTTVKLLTSGTIVNNVLIVGTPISSIADGTSGVTFQILQGNQSNYGGFPGVPNTIRNFVL